VFLEFGDGYPTVAFPFKLNPDWMNNESFVGIVRQVWNDLRHLLIVRAQRRLVGKLSLLKSRVKVWAKEKHQRDQSDLIKIEEAIDYSYKQLNMGISTVEDAITLSKHETERK
jgi:hypothetical protein